MTLETDGQRTKGIPVRFRPITPPSVGRSLRGRAIGLAAAICLLMPASTRAQAVASSERCAQTDAYTAFEEEQYNQYMLSPAFQQQLTILRDIRSVLESIDQLSQKLDQRPNLLSEGSDAGRENDAEALELIRKGLTNQKLPTCYENPLTYFMLSSYASDIEQARKRLGLPLVTPINLATLPTDEINAYTYPVLDGEERVVAVNTQLFMFAYQMTKVTLPTVGLRSTGDGVAISVGSGQIDNEVLVNFAMAIQEFLNLIPPSTQPLDQAYDTLLMTMVEGVEKFVIAHEYGHVVKGHSSPVGRFRLGSAADAVRTNVEIPVLLRSWQQEIEADETGFRLLAASLQATLGKESSPERRAYTLYGALFFFRLMEITEEAKVLLETGHLPAPPTLSEKQFVRSYLAGATTLGQQQDYASLLSADHPPSWVRKERVAALLQEELTDYPPGQLGQDYLEIATAIDRNAELIWTRVAQRLPLIFKAVQALREPGAKPAETLVAPDGHSEDASPDCPMPASEWAGQSICTSELMRAINAFSSKSVTDEETLRLYGAALQRDWLLFSGAQVDWATRSISERSDIDFALALIALTGTIETLPKLDSMAASFADDVSRARLIHARQFVQAHGRATSLNALASADPRVFRREAFLAYPSPVTNDLDDSFGQIPARTPLLDRFFVAHGAADVDGSMAGMMAASLYLRHTEGAALTTFADILLQMKRYDAALAFARAGKERGGLGSMVDNTIGNILSAQGKLGEANEYYLASLRAGRVDGWPEINMALNYSRSGDKKAAEQWFRAGLARRATARSSGEYAQYLNGFAWFLVTNYPDDKQRVAEALQLSLESNDLTAFADANFLDTLAESLFLSGEVTRAIEVAEAAADASTDPAERSEYRGKAERWKAAIPSK